MEADQGSKRHHKASSGAKAEKKRLHKLKKRGIDAKRENPKAFGVSGGGQSLLRAQRRNADISQKRQRAPVVDRAPEVPPPYVIAVVGPPGVGKSLIIKSLVKHYTRQTLTEIRGPITVISGKKRRLTFFECPNDLNAMIDVAKIADLALLVVDAGFGFEMETFEMLNIMQVHGFPKVMGVLTHLDKFKSQKTLRRVKKDMKKRFWTEIYDGAKLFYLSGLINGQYLKREIHNLARFISVAKFKPLLWRNTHPYVLIDRVEDLTNPDEVQRNPHTDRTVSLYGYVRGTALKDATKVHIPGLGDARMHKLSNLPDPAPLPEKERKRLDEKERLVYAPMSNVGGVMFDRDAVYINVSDHKLAFSKREDLVGDEKEVESALQAANKVAGEGESMVRQLQDHLQGLDESLGEREGEFRLFSSVPPTSNNASEENDEHDGSDSDDDFAARQMRKEVAVLGNKLSRTGSNEDLSSSDSENDGTSSDEDDDSDSSSGEDDSEGDNEDGSDNDSDKDIDDESDSGDDEEEESEDKAKKSSARSAKSRRRAPPSLSESGSASNNQTEGGNHSDTAAWESDDNSESAASDDGGEEGESESDGEDDGERRAAALPISRGKKHKYYDASQAVRRDAVTFADESASEASASESDDDAASASSSAGSSSSSSEESDDEAFRERRWREALGREAASRIAAGRSIADLVYKRNEARRSGSGSTATGGTVDSEDSGSDEDDDLLVPKGRSAHSGAGTSQRHARDGESGSDCDDLDTSKPLRATAALESLRERLAGRFVTSMADDEMLAEGNDGDAAQANGDDSDGDGASHSGESDGGDDGDASDEEAAKRREAKAQLKARFDLEYDEEHDGAAAERNAIDEQKQRNAELLGDGDADSSRGMDDDARIRVEGYRAGRYVRIELRGVPAEFIRYFDGVYPIILGGLQPNEEQSGLLQVRLKKHRWHRKILKNRDPVIVSIGWRRFQTVPTYAMRDPGGRMRMLKYTPEHLHCVAVFQGPVTPPNTGVCAFQTLSGSKKSFRISATGVTMQQDQSFRIVKKLKLTGTPMKVKRNTAFIKDMFTSSLEVAKFQGASIRTVSGIRGTVKKAIKAPPGAFRATFEDKILMSDIVFLRAWTDVEIPRLYNPVDSLLRPAEDRAHWIGMRTVAEIRRENALPIPQNPDSEYRPIERIPRKFNPLRVPKSLEAALPFTAKPKIQRKRRATGKSPLDIAKSAAVLEPAERKAASLMQQLHSIKNERERKKRRKEKERRKSLAASAAKEEEARKSALQPRRKAFYRRMGKSTGV